MTFLDLVRKSAWRKPTRAILLVVSVTVAFLIYGLTASFINGTQGTTGASENILGVLSATGSSQPLPFFYINRLQSDADVSALNYIVRLRGFSNVEKNVIAVTATDPQRLMAVSGAELGLTPALIHGLTRQKDMALVGKALAQAQGWTVGQHVTVTSFGIAQKNGSRNWSFEIAGIFNGATASTDTYFMIARYDYVNASRARYADTVDAFVVRPKNNISPGEVAAKIDALFANSAAPTRTQSEKQFLEAFLRQYADVGLIVNLVVGAAFTTLLMIVGNAMVFAIRERTFEIGVLKTVGFSGPRIILLILAETLFIFTVGGATGLGLAKLATMFSDSALGLVFTAGILSKAVGLIFLLSLVTGALPAFNALRIPIISAFRSR